MLSLNSGSLILVIDGGWLLHQLSWSDNETFGSIADSYIQLAKRRAHGCQILVVFDGYNNSTKDHEHRRRSKGSSCPPIGIMCHKSCPVTKTKFMSNNKNKESFISFLAAKINNDGFETFIEEQ